MGEDDRGLFDVASIAENYRLHLEPSLFGPWARELVAFTGVRPGEAVLDVAAGTGAATRAAALAVGPSGSVMATDISASMLDQISLSADPDAAPIRTLVCSATELDVPDSSIDVALCHQGFPFIPDRAAVAREMFRVLRPGGRAGVAVWKSGESLQPFDTYAVALREVGAEFYPGWTLDNDKLLMTEDEVGAALRDGGFTEVEVRTVRRAVRWPSIESEVLGVTGTPFAQLLANLDETRRDAVLASLAEALSLDGAPQEHVTTAVLGRGVR